jgi:hypothetical protein
LVVAKKRRGGGGGGKELAVAGAAPKRKRSSDEYRRHMVGKRIYDSELGVTCHWCRQKTEETHVAFTAEGCGRHSGSARAGFPVSFCGGCLRNRHGEDVDAAVGSVGVTNDSLWFHKTLFCASL